MGAERTGYVGLSGVPALPEPGLDPALAAGLRELEEIGASLEEHQLAASTRRAYQRAWGLFEGFCAAHDLQALPAHPSTVRWYVAWASIQVDPGSALPRFSVSSIRQHLAGIAHVHLQAGHLDPTGHQGVSAVVRGLGRLRATASARRRPLLLEDVLQVVTAMEHDRYPAGISATRDTCAIWLGFAGALRRSEAAALRMRDVRLGDPDGVVLRLGVTKTDQENLENAAVVLPYGSTPRTCAPCALHRWVALVLQREDRREVMAQLLGYQLSSHVCGQGRGQGLVSGSDLRSEDALLRATYRNRHSGTIHDAGVTGDALHTMLLTRMAEAGLDTREHGFHSLRVGFVTQARRSGASFRAVRRQTRHRSDVMVDLYDRDNVPARGNAVTQLGL